MGPTSTIEVEGENILAPITLLNRDNLWEHATKQTREIADLKYGPACTFHLVKSCKNAGEAEYEIRGFLADPDQWYRANNIPVESVVKATRIRQDFLRQSKVKAFKIPNIRLQ